MKPIIFIVLAVLTFFVDTPEARALFGHTAEERQRRIAVERQLSQEQRRLDAQQRLTVEQQKLTNRWQITAFVLGIAAVVSLIVGTAIGSRGRHHANAAK